MVLTVWTPAAVQLARAGSFVVAIPNEGEVDEQEAEFAQRIADEGAEGARTRGYNAVCAGRRIGPNQSPRRSMRSPRRSTPD